MVIVREISNNCIGRKTIICALSKAIYLQCTGKGIARYLTKIRLFFLLSSSYWSKLEDKNKWTSLKLKLKAILRFKLSSKVWLKLERERKRAFYSDVFYVVINEEGEEKYLPFSGMERDLSVTLTFRSSVVDAELLWIFGWCGIHGKAPAADKENENKNMSLIYISTAHNMKKQWKASLWRRRRINYATVLEAGKGRWLAQIGNNFPKTAPIF